ncbi:MAG: SDR family oxidoreductase [Gemmatimonadota bacterium]|nr:SDR family oxidoreductase [Gemmatimonadota bacterium]
MKVLVTGANGFVGAALTARLIADRRHVIVGAVRRASAELPPGVTRVQVGALGPETDWRPAIGVHAVVHLAARVHIISDAITDPLAEYRRVNVAGTCILARQAALAGVKRFVFLSSVKVNGESGRYTEADLPAPEDAYAISKYEAEIALRAIANETGMEVVIIRPPLVYGPGVRANFLALMRAVSRGIPLPFGAVDNRRSLVALSNLVDFIITCIEHPAAANETFLLSDGEDLSTTDLIRRLARAMGRPARLLPVPKSVLIAGAVLLGQRDVAQRLLSTLQVDISKARQLVRWEPPITVDEGLRLAVAAL